MKPRLFIFLAALIINSLQTARDRRVEVRTLIPSQTIEREMKGSEIHAYLINLRRGEFMRAEVEQRGINVVVSLFAPDGRKLVAMDNRQIGYGLEPLSFAAEAAGAYRLEVGAASAKAISGRYTLHLNELRSVTASDWLRISAERSTAEGQRLRMQGTADSYRRALNCYQAALNSWREIGDRYWEATTLTNIGVVHEILGEKQKALEFYNQALMLSRQAKDVSGEARVLNNLGNVYDSLGEKQKALEFHNKALPIRRLLGDKTGEAGTLVGIGNIYNALGEKQKALGSYNQALPIYRTLGDKPGEGNTLVGIGNIYTSLGDKQKALEFYNQALPIYRVVSDKSCEANTLNNLGKVYDSLGDKQKALEFYNQALPIYRAVGDKAGEAATLNSLGVFYYSVGEKQKALQFYNQALPIRRAVGDKSAEAETLNNLGNYYNSLGEKQKALEFYNQALPIRRAVGDKSGEADTLNNLGAIFDSLGEKQKALGFYNQALPIYRAVSNKSGEATTLNNLGAVYDSLGEKQKALEFYNQALPIYLGVSDKSCEAHTLNNLGKVYDSLGQKQKAIEFYNQALPIYRAVRNKAGEADTLNNLGVLYNSLGEKQKALGFYNQALTIYRATSDKSCEATTLNNFGNIYNSLGEKQKALEFYNQALLIKRAVGDKSGEATTLNNMGQVYDSLGEKQKALEFYNQALPIRRTVGDKSGEADTLNNLGNIYNSLGQKQKALGFYNQALPIYQAVGDISCEADTLNNLGAIFDSLGQKQKALTFYNKAVRIYRAVGGSDGEALTLANLMLLSYKQGKPSQAVFYGKQSINVLQQLRANISGLEKHFQQSFLHSKEYAYRELATILITRGRLLEAEEVLALLKDEEYASLRRRDHPKSSVGYSTAEIEAVNALHRLGELGREANELRDRRDKNLLDERGRRRLDQIERELLPKANAAFDNTLDEIERTGTVVRTPEVTASKSLRPRLSEMGPGTVALYTVVSTEKGKSSQGWVILVTPDFQRAYEMDVAGLYPTVAEFRQTLSSDTYDPQPLARKLYQMIFLKPQKQGNTLAGDLDAYLRDQKEKTLMWSLDGVLRYVPMAALHNGENYLVEKYRNVIFTNSSHINLMIPTSIQWNALGLGVSKQFESFPPLEGVPKELAAIVRDAQKGTRGVLPGTIKWDDEFKEKAMMDSLREGYKVVHIASHFSYEAANDEKSFLLLGDGSHLEISKIRDQVTLFAKTDLLTLSACETAVGSSMNANGKDVEGFAYVAQDLGAKAVIASLWRVDDVATQVLMPKFYAVRKSNPGMVKAEALRQAKLSLLQGSLGTFEHHSIRARRVSGTAGTGVAPLFTSDPKAPYAHPYYWAPFVLIGNWR